MTDWIDLLEREISGQTTKTADILSQARELDPGYRSQPHLQYLAERLQVAIEDVEAGKNRRLIISMPPRTGKSYLTSQVFPVWALRRHPEWPVALVSHEANLATSWGRQIRRWVEGRDLGIDIASDAGAVGEWETSKGGGVLSRSIGGSLTGRGAKLLMIDDPIKDFVAAHSKGQRDAVWNWWLTVAQTRLQPPYLIIVIATRWHEDDLIGRLLSNEYEGSPDQWENIVFPAIAQQDDVLGRSTGQPLYSPLIDEDEVDAVLRWDEVKTSVGTYAYSAMYQQNPSPAQGKIFNVNWWRFWTRSEKKAEENDRFVHFDPDTAYRGQWIDSWDCSFKDKEDSDYVVGQRWCRVGPNRFLVAQKRGRFSFTKTLEEMRSWARQDTAPGGRFTHKRVVEDKANGTAVIDVMKNEIAGMVPENPTDSKEARARSITPECESGHVLFPDPSEPGNEWVQELLSELREFNQGAHDDQVDALSQALKKLRTGGSGQVTVPGRNQSRTIERKLGSEGMRPLR